MGLLDANVPQMVSSSSSFADQAGLMRSTIAQADASAQQAQATHQGDSAVAFQVAHTRFVEAAGKINTLLDVAGANIHEGAGTYTAQDAAGASDIASAGGALPV
ncbi:WXG100 family type VII secretion target [Mycobacterium sp. SMC-13]|uniref:WXG100 family type VII secretion target n=1 Tax=Mycobacterium sp. SMC-13 TaxID=3381626 RepID=UPI0038765765